MVATGPKPLPRALILLGALLLQGCLVQEELLTEPCAADCNAQARLGSPCATETDCAQGMLCNLGFPGGYCQVGCEAPGAACGAQGEGQCLSNPSGDPPGLCLARCDPNAPGSCASPQAACYPDAGGAGEGLCHLRCAAHADCEGLACDGQGLCRPPKECNGLTDGGCLEDGLRCYVTANLGAWCGLPGGKAEGEACQLEADCAAGTWCLQGRCLRRCDTDDFTACGGVPARCAPLVAGNRLGFCVQ
jgi:hypothetical protein